MSSRKDKYSGYICFELNENDKPTGNIIINSDLKNVDNWIALRAKKPESTPPGEPAAATQKETEAEERGSSLKSLMVSFTEAISGFHQLIAVNSFMLPQVRRIFIRREIYEFANKELSIVKEKQKFPIFGIKLEQYQIVNRQIGQLMEMDRGFDVLPSAIILSLVATFDSHFSDIVRILLSQRPDRYSNSTRSLTVKEILSMDSFADLRERLIEDEIDSIMRGSHDEQIKFIEGNFGVSIREHYEGWADFIEVFERRNLAAHGKLQINKYYFENCNAHGFKVEQSKIGEIIKLTPSYLHQAVDLLLEFGITLMFVLWRKNFDNVDNEAYEQLNDVTYQLIRTGRYKVAAKLLEFALYHQKVGAPEALRKMMTVNLANAQKKSGNDDRCSEILDATDWSASADEFKICIASLRGETDEVVKLMPRVARAETVTKIDFRDWPVFDWVRDEPGFRACFQETFGEPLIAEGADAVESSEPTLDASEGNTMH